MRTRAWIAGFAAAAALACGGSKTFTPIEIAGSNPSVLATPDGAPLVVFIRDARLMLRRGAEEFAVSPTQDRVDARGESAPLLVRRASGELVAIYVAAKTLRTQTSRDGGRIWSAPRRVDDDPAPRSHAFADAAVTRDGSVVVSWLDSRAGQQGVQTTLIHADGTVDRDRTDDAKTCQCCRTALHASADGAMWLAYRDLTDDNVRNMAYAISRDDARTFQLRGDIANDGWKVNGCPESGPRFAQTPDGTTWVAWLNGAKNAIEVARSRGGAPFGAPIVAGTGNHPEIGTLADGRLVVFYERGTGIAARLLDHATPIEIAAEGRFPRFSRAGDRAALAFTHFVDGKPFVTVIDPTTLLEKQ